MKIERICLTFVLLIIMGAIAICILAIGWHKITHFRIIFGWWFELMLASFMVYFWQPVYYFVSIHLINK